MDRPLRIGIAGARGIGKHHAKWFAQAGCEVTAVYGTSEASVERAAAGLRDLFGFTGRTYHDWDRFLAEGGFDACSVCSPAERHRENVESLAARGVHLLCEKPLVWDWDKTPEQLRADAAATVKAATDAGVVFALNAQYPAAIPGWIQLYETVRGEAPILEEGFFVMDTKGLPRSTHGAAEVWVDLAPHPLALMDHLNPGGIDWSTLRHSSGPMQVEVHFEWVSGEFRIGGHIECRRTPEGPVRRQLGNQDLMADWDGANVNGEFCSVLSAEGKQWVGKDFMRVSVERFIDAVTSGDPSRVLVGPAGALRQHEALVGVWERLWRS
jgi:predicted dehydrogenase